MLTWLKNNPHYGALISVICLIISIGCLIVVITKL